MRTRVAQGLTWKRRSTETARLNLIVRFKSNYKCLLAKMERSGRLSRITVDFHRIGSNNHIISGENSNDMYLDKSVNVV